MESKELLFEVHAPLGKHCFKVYLDGTVEGFPEGSAVVNHALPLWGLMRGKLLKSEAPNAQAHPSGAIIYKWTGPGGLEVTTGIEGDEAHDIVSVGEDLCLCFGPRKLTPAEVCLVRRSAAPDAPAYDSIYGGPPPPFFISGGSDSPDAAAG